MSVFLILCQNDRVSVVVHQLIVTVRRQHLAVLGDGDAVGVHIRRDGTCLSGCQRGVTVDIHPVAEAQTASLRSLVRIDQHHHAVCRQDVRHGTLEDVDVKAFGRGSRLVGRLEFNVPGAALCLAQGAQNAGEEVVGLGAGILNAHGVLLPAVHIIGIVAVKGVVLVQIDQHGCVGRHRNAAEIIGREKKLALAFRLGEILGLADLECADSAVDPGQFAVHRHGTGLPVAPGAHRKGVAVALLQCRLHVQDCGVPVALVRHIDHREVALVYVLGRRIEDDLCFGILFQDILRQRGGALHVSGPVAAFQLRADQTVQCHSDRSQAVPRLARNEIVRVAVRHDDGQDHIILRKDALCLPAYLAHRPLKAGLAARGHAHTGGSIQDDDLFVFGCLRNIRNHRTRQEHREGGKHQHLAQEDQDVPQPADRHALFPVLQASLPDVCTGNDLLLVVRLDDIDKYQHRHRKKTQKPKRSK